MYFHVLLKILFFDNDNSTDIDKIRCIPNTQQLPRVNVMGGRATTSIKTVSRAYSIYNRVKQLENYKKCWSTSKCKRI